jgi:hypothetical protein
MRAYSKTSPTFWVKGSGKRLRGHANGQRVAHYLLSAPGSNMIGLYYLPLSAICNDVGMTEEEALNGLGRCEEVDFAHYDRANEIVWIPNVAEIEIGETLGAGDKRRRLVQNDIEVFEKHPFAIRFHDRYGAAYGLARPLGVPTANPHPSSQHAPCGVGFQASMGHALIAIQEQEQGNREEQEQDHYSTAALPGADATPEPKPSKRGTRLTPDWRPSPATIEWAKNEGIDARAHLPEFVDHWLGVPGTKGLKLDWEATFRNRLRDQQKRGFSIPWRKPLPPPPSPADLPPMTESQQRLLDDAIAKLGSQTRIVATQATQSASTPRPPAAPQRRLGPRTLAEIESDVAKLPEGSQAAARAILLEEREAALRGVA